MRTSRLIHRSGVRVTPERTLREAAETMEQAGVGTLAVLDHGRLVGIVTDRDLVRRAMARGLPLDARVDAVMSAPVVTIDGDADDEQVSRAFSIHGVRRLAVVGDDGAFLGILSLDDVLIRLARQMSEITRPITSEVLVADRDPAVPAVVSTT